MYRCFSLLFMLFYTTSGLNIPGATKPLGFFDPLGFSKNKPQSEIVKLREAELKHCRWGMISSVAIPVTELVTHKQAIHALDDANLVALAAFTGLAGAAELQSILLGWENPFINSSKYFVMKEDYQPGNLGLGLPLSFLGNDETFMANAELNNGRLAMIASLGMIVQELVFNEPIF
jgi:hypothetical protein